MRSTRKPLRHKNNRLQINWLTVAAMTGAIAALIDAINGCRPN